MSKCLQPQNFKDFTTHKLGDVPINKLMKYMDQVMAFLETVEPQSAHVNAYIRKLHSCTFTRGVEVEHQSVALSAQDNYLNIRACYTRENDMNPPELENFNARQRTIDVQAYYWFKTLFDINAPEIKQFESRIKVQPELATYTELALYLFQTRSRSPVVTWGNVAENLDLVENRLLTDFQNHPIAAVKDRLQEFIEEYNNVQLLPWQVLVSKMYRYAVKANSKRSVEFIDHEVLAFLSHAQNGDTVPTPNINEWANGILNIMSEDKEFSELKKTNHRIKDVTHTEAIVVTNPLQVNAVYTKDCIECNTSFVAKEDRYKRCGSCQTEWRKKNPYTQYPGHSYSSPSHRPVMMVTRAENQLDEVYSSVYRRQVRYDSKHQSK